METIEIQDMHDVYVYAAGLDGELEHLHYENAAKLFILYQISLDELCQLDDDTMGSILCA